MPPAPAPPTDLVAFALGAQNLHEFQLSNCCFVVVVVVVADVVVAVVVGEVAVQHGLIFEPVLAIQSVVVMLHKQWTEDRV